MNAFDKVSNEFELLTRTYNMIDKVFTDNINVNIEKMRHQNKEFVIEAIDTIKQDIISAVDSIVDAEDQATMLKNAIRIEFKILTDVASRNIA